MHRVDMVLRSIGLAGLRVQGSESQDRSHS